MYCRRNNHEQVEIINRSTGAQASIPQKQSSRHSSRLSLTLTHELCTHTQKRMKQLTAKNTNNSFDGASQSMVLWLCQLRMISLEKLKGPVSICKIQSEKKRYRNIRRNSFQATSQHDVSRKREIVKNIPNLRVLFSRYFHSSCGSPR